MNNDKTKSRVGKSTNEIKSLLNQHSFNQATKFEENMIHAFSLLSPLKSENEELKNKILATQNYLEQQREKLSNIVRETESRQLIKRISDFPTLISIFKHQKYVLKQQNLLETEKLQQQEEKINILSEERNKNYERIIQEVSEKEQIQAETIVQQAASLNEKNQLIEKLQNLVEDENIKIKKNQNSHYEMLDSYNEKLDELTEQLNEEMEKQVQMKDKYTQMIQQLQNDHQTQVAIKQDQYEFALGELRNTYEKRMEKLIKDSEFRISEANKACIRANKELEQVRTKYEQEIQKNEQQVNFIKNLQIQLQQAQQQSQNYRAQMQQQQLYLHQTQALVNSLKKSSALSTQVQDIPELSQFEEKSFNQALENLDFQMQSIGNQTNEEKMNQEFEDQFQQTSPQLSAQRKESAKFSPSEFKLNLKNAEYETTQNSPYTQIKATDEKLSQLYLDEEQNQIKKLNLMKKLRKKRNQKSKNRDEYFQRINETQFHDYYGSSPKFSEETPISKPKNPNFSYAFSTQNNMNLKRRSHWHQAAQLQSTEQCSQFQIQTSDEICQTEINLIEIQPTAEMQQIQMNQAQIGNNNQNTNFFTPARFRQNSNYLDSGSNFDGNEFSIQQLPTDQESYQPNKGEVQMLKERIAQLQTQNSQQAKNISELQQKAEKMQNNFQKNFKEMKIQIQRSTQENTNLLKQIERPKEGAKKKIELQKHLESQISISDNLQSQLSKATEIIKYFNQELENYKQLYNIFGQGSKSERLRNNKLPSLKPQGNIKSYNSTSRKQSSMYEEAQRLIDNLYERKIVYTKQN